MQNRYSKVLVRSIPLQRFIDANGVILPVLTAGGGRNGFDAALQRMARFGDAQGAHRAAGSGELSYERKLARSIRRRHMFPIVRVSRAKVPAAAQLEPVRMPKLRSNSAVLIRQAREMAEAVTPYRQLLHEAGMPADFIERLLDSVAELEKVSGAKLGHFAKRVGATENIDTEFETLKVELNMVDSLVLSALEDHPEKLGEWRTLTKGVRSAFREVSRSLGVVEGTEAPPAGTPSAPAAPALSLAA
jgi:hypothetical protein